MSEENKQYFLSKNASDSLFGDFKGLELSVFNWKEIADDLEEKMDVGQFCAITGTQVEKDPNMKRIESYRDRLYEALGNVEGDYELTILDKDEFYRLQVKRK